MCFLVFREVLSLHAPELALHCTAKFPFFVISVVHIKLTWQLDGSISLWQSNINIHWSRKCVALPRISQLRNSPFRSHFYPSLISFSLSSAVADDWFFAKVILKLMWNFFFTSGCCWKKKRWHVAFPSTWKDGLLQMVPLRISIIASLYVIGFHRDMADFSWMTKIWTLLGNINWLIWIHCPVCSDPFW